MKGFHMVIWILLVVGGLNWGLEAFGWGLGKVLPATPAMILYILVGLSALVEIFTHKKNCSCCNGSCEPKGPAPM